MEVSGSRPLQTTPLLACRWGRSGKYCRLSESGRGEHDPASEPSDGDWLTFEFDCDTDKRPGTNGNAIAGVVVTVEFRSGVVSSGAIVADANDPNQSFVQL